MPPIADGTLTYSFVESVQAMHPYFIVRFLGGAFFLFGTLVMAWNIWRTIAGAKPAVGAIPAPGCGSLRRQIMATGHDKIEKNIGLMIILIIITVSIGGLVQIVPLFFQGSMTEAVAGLEPYSPLRLTGRDIYVREGCYLCHSQMIRPFRAETERYGHYSVAGEFVYDRPFQWGSKRTGPDLARVGGRYSDEWHRVHLINPRDVVPESIMPGYPVACETNAADAGAIQQKAGGVAHAGCALHAMTRSIDQCTAGPRGQDRDGCHDCLPAGYGDNGDQDPEMSGWILR